MKRNHFPSLLIAAPYITKTGYTESDSTGSPLQGSPFPALVHYVTLLPETQDAVRKAAIRKENSGVWLLTIGTVNQLSRAVNHLPSQTNDEERGGL